MDRNFPNRRGSSPASKRRETRNNKASYKNGPQEKGSPSSSDQEATGTYRKTASYTKKAPASGHQPSGCSQPKCQHAPPQSTSPKQSYLQQQQSETAASIPQPAVMKTKPSVPTQKKKVDSSESDNSGKPVAKKAALLKEDSPPQQKKQLVLEEKTQNPNEEVERVARKLLDDRYLLLKTIGHGRYAKVKLALDLKTRNQVAIKILKVKAGRATEFSKHQSLECLFSEISILADCDHKNIVKIKAANFDGVIVKLMCLVTESDEESLIRRYNSDSSSNSSEVTRQIQNITAAESILLAEEDRLEFNRSYGSDEVEEPVIVKRQGPVCYYVMNFAKYGELYRLVEMNERLSEPLVRYLFKQLVDGLHYLHKEIGVVHRDIKPENLLIDKHFRLVIADFNFATRLTQKFPGNQATLPAQMPEGSNFNNTVKRDISVGSVSYNAPELWEIEAQLSELRQRNEISETDPELLKYDGVKSDIFSAAATLFLLKMKYQPFRRAHPMDPYYKKLAFKGKKYFWKIYSKIPTSALFKDIFEKMIGHNPDERLDTSGVLEHEFTDDSEFCPEDMQYEIITAFKQLEETLGENTDPFSDENPGAHRADDTFDPGEEEWVRQDDEQFNQLRHTLIADVHRINKILRKRRYRKHVGQNQQYETAHQSSYAKDKEIGAEAAQQSPQPTNYLINDSELKQMLAELPPNMVPSVFFQQPEPPELQGQQPFVAQLAAEHQTQMPVSQVKGTAAQQYYHSDENKSQGSNDSGTFAREGRRARRTSSYSRFQSFNDEDGEEE